MAKLPRKLEKVFASGAANNGQFGSAQDATFILSNDVDVLQANPAYLQGWADATVSSEQLPTLEEMQGVQYVQAYQTAYLFQEGIPEYLSTATYYQNSIVKKAGTLELYGSVTDNNTGNALTDPSKWTKLVDLQNTVQVYAGAVTTGSANAQATAVPGTYTRKYGNLLNVVAGFSNSAAMTLDADGTGATAVKKGGTSGVVDLVTGDWVVGEAYTLFDNVTYWELVDPSLPTFGTAASVNTGTSGATIPLLNGNNVYSGTASFTGATWAFSGATSFTVSAAATISVGTAVGASTINVGTGVITTGLTKSINIGTAGASGSTTNIAIGSATAGALGTVTINQTITTPQAINFSAVPTALPANGMYLGAANSPAISANGLCVVLFTANASAVNYWELRNAATGNSAQIFANGSDANVFAAYYTKGSGSHSFYTNSAVPVCQFSILHAASAVNYVQVQGGATGAATIVSSQGADAAITLQLNAKGNSSIQFVCNSALQAFIAGTASATNYWQIAGSNGGDPGISVLGAGTNIGMSFTGKGNTVTFAFKDGASANAFRVAALGGTIATSLYIQPQLTANDPSLAAEGTDTNINVAIFPKGTGSFKVRDGASGANIFIASRTVAGVSLNYFEFTARGTGNAPILYAQGGDANVSMALVPKGTGSFNVLANDGNTSSFIVTQAGTVVNGIQANAGKAAGTSPDITWFGTDTNINAVLVAKGTGVLVCLGSYTNTAALSGAMTINSSGLIQRQSSQAKYKPVVEDIEVERAMIFYDKFRPIWHTSNLESSPDGWSYYGAIAEEVAAIEKRMAIVDYEFTEKYDKDGQPILSKKKVPVSVAYDRIGVLLHVAYKAKFSLIGDRQDAAEEEILQLKNRVAELEKQITVH